MRSALGYVTTFVGGFTACALILHFTGVDPVKSRYTAAPNPIQAIIEERSSPRGNGMPSVADAAAKVEPAVVNIDIAGKRESGGPFSFLRPGASEEFEGSGSGIILTADGYVVTNNHVIEDVVEGRDGAITIKLDNGKQFDNVSVVGRDPMTDLAVLKIHGASNLPTAELGDSDALRVGDWAVAVGNPLGFNSTVTLGIVSALNRRNFRSESDALDRVIQTDAAINPGNSGGALADIDGRVVGINTAIASSTGGSVGIGFAIPINSAKKVIDALIAEGKVVRPYLGIVYSPVESIDQSALPPGVTLPQDGKGVVVVGDRGAGTPVIPNSPAAKAGIQQYDVLREINGQEIDDIRSVKEQVQNRAIGEQVPLTVWRNGQILHLTVTLDRMPEDYGSLPGRRRRGLRTMPRYTPNNDSESQP